MKWIDLNCLGESDEVTYRRVCIPAVIRKKEEVGDAVVAI